MYVYPGDTWTLTRNLKYVQGATWAESNYSVYVRAGDQMILARPPEVTMSFAAPTMDANGNTTDGHVSISFGITATYSQDVLHQVSIMYETATGTDFGVGVKWNKVLTTGGFVVKARNTTPKVTG